MNRARLFAALVMMVATALPGTLLGAGDLKITHVWARATPPGAPAGAAYFRVTTEGPADELTGVSSPVSGKAMMHRSVESGGQVSMEHVHAVPLTADEPIVFQPGGYHVMLMQLNKQLKAGESFPMTLHFEKAGERQVEVMIKPIGTTREDIHDHGHHDH